VHVLEKWNNVLNVVSIPLFFLAIIIAPIIVGILYAAFQGDTILAVDNGNDLDLYFLEVFLLSNVEFDVRLTEQRVGNLQQRYEYQTLSERNLLAQVSNRSSLHTALIRLYGNCDLTINENLDDGTATNLIGTRAFACYETNFTGLKADRNDTILVAAIDKNVELNWILVIGIKQIDINDAQGPMRVIGSCSSYFCLVDIDCVVNQVDGNTRSCSSQSFVSEFSIVQIDTSPNTKNIVIVRDVFSSQIFPNLVSIDHLVNAKKYQDIDIVSFAFALSSLFGVTVLVIGMVSKLLLYFLVK